MFLWSNANFNSQVFGTVISPIELNKDVVGGVVVLQPALHNKQWPSEI